MQLTKLLVFCAMLLATLITAAPAGLTAVVPDLDVNSKDGEISLVHSTGNLAEDRSFLVGRGVEAVSHNGQLLGRELEACGRSCYSNGDCAIGGCSVCNGGKCTPFRRGGGPTDEVDATVEKRVPITENPADESSLFTGAVCGQACDRSADCRGCAPNALCFQKSCIQVHRLAKDDVSDKALIAPRTADNIQERAVEETALESITVEEIVVVTPPAKSTHDNTDHPIDAYPCSVELPWCFGRTPNQESAETVGSLD